MFDEIGWQVGTGTVVSGSVASSSLTLQEAVFVEAATGLVTFGVLVGTGPVNFGVNQSVEVLHTLDSAGFWDESALSGILGFGEFQPDSVVLVEGTETVGQWVGGWVDAWHASEEWRLGWSMGFPFWCSWVSIRSVYKKLY